MASRILLADDSITIQKVVNLTFADEGIEVVAVSNGETAEKRLSEINPDLVLADIFMPGKNGYELCEYIKQSSQFSDVPVVLLVGAFEPFDQAEAKRVKADTHLTKPFESRVLVETVRRLINKGSKPSTGSLGSMAAASATPPEAQPVEEVAAAEHHDTRAMASPLLNIDLNAMSDSASPLETGHLDPAAVTSASGFNTLSDSSPLDLDYPSFVEEPVAQGQPSPHLQFGEDPYRQTQQLASLNSQEQAELLAAQPFESSVLVEEDPATAQSEISDDLSFMAQAPREWPEPNSGTPSAFGYSPPEVLLDFEQVQSPETPGPDNEVTLDVEAADQAPEQPDQVALQKTEDELDTGKLERPAKEAAESVEAGGSDESEPEQGVTIGPATSLLLSADNPFDVLFDDRPQEPSTSTADAAQEPDSMAPLSPVSGFSTLEIASEITSPSFVDEQHAEASAPQISAAEDLASPEETEIESAVSEEETTKEWHPAAEAASSGFQIESAESVETEIAPEQPAPSLTSSEIEDEKFSSAAMWSEAETQFTPIDIEAVQVTEPAATERSQHETGFDFQPVDEAPPAERAIAEPPQPAPAQETSTPQTVTEAGPSPELIDEIVRRVVAQMSDQVVREIAWEVVPDCVERVVKELARDELSKKM
ncbi:MAG TPA: response regulator [Blastocatellia bacterium]|nr:response regulator [Blastocatellia bacterium]